MTHLVKNKKIRSIIIISILFSTISFFLLLFFVLLSFRTPSPKKFYVDSNDTYDSIKVKVGISSDSYQAPLFDFLAKTIFQLPKLAKVGHYEFNKNISYIEVIRRIRNGTQTPIKVYIPSSRSIEKILSITSRYFLFSYDSLLNTYYQFIDTSSLFTPAEAFCLFIPNTYEFYWTTSPEQFLKRMVKEYQRFWNKSRRKKAEELNLTPCQVITLASIVQEETTKKKEYRRIAGVYVNRLRKGMPLQADPTVRFALGNFTRQRILLKDFEIDSPYNTYKYTGLPPGPINNPYPEVIDAVLNYEPHDFLFFCASVDSPGYHVFTKTYEQHLIYANKYQQWLNRIKIYR